MGLKCFSRLAAKTSSLSIASCDLSRFQGELLSMCVSLNGGFPGLCPPSSDPSTFHRCSSHHVLPGFHLGVVIGAMDQNLGQPLSMQ